MDEDAFIGEIKLIAGKAAPEGWRLCDGALVPVSDYRALFEIVGTTYGGDGVSNFALPNFEGRAQVGSGQPQGPTTYRVGMTGGDEKITLTLANLPLHSHPLYASRLPASSYAPVNQMLATVEANYTLYGGSGTDVVMDPTAYSAVGGQSAVNNMMPSAVLTYVICTNGQPLPRSSEQGEA